MTETTRAGTYSSGVASKSSRPHREPWAYSSNLGLLSDKAKEGALRPGGRDRRRVWTLRVRQRSMSRPGPSEGRTRSTSVGNHHGRSARIRRSRQISRVPGCSGKNRPSRRGTCHIGRSGVVSNFGFEAGRLHSRDRASSRKLFAGD